MIGVQIYEDIIVMVNEGDLDDHLNSILISINARRAYLALEEGQVPPPTPEARTYQRGQRVRFNSRVRPKYMEGRTAVVTKTSYPGTKTAQIRMDVQEGRFQGDGVRAYKNSLDFID